jgi:Ala-tRNA(Pro) deacylase
MTTTLQRCEPHQLMHEVATRYGGFELIPHPATLTAGDEAAVLGVAPDEVAKTVVLVTPTGHVRAVLPASARLDLHKVRRLIGGGKGTRLASEDELADAYPMFEVGAVPPFGGPTGDPAVVDRRLADLETVVLEAGSHRESVRMGARDLLTMTHARIADICVD